MKKRLLLQYALPVLVFLNPVFLTGVWAVSDTFLWIGGAIGNWEDGANWKNLDSMTVGLLPLPEDDVMIDGAVTVTVNSNLVIESVQLSGGAKLVIAAGAILSTTEGGLDGSNSIRLDAVSPNNDYPSGTFVSVSGSSELIVHGTLNLDNDDAAGSGLYVEEGTSVTVSNTGSVFITNEGSPTRTEAIVVRGDGASLTNNGTITVIQAGKAGIRTTGANNSDYNIVNNGTLTISGGDIGIQIGSVWMENHGTIKVSVPNITNKIITLGGRFKNFGTFGGNGTIDVIKTTRLIFESGCRIAPGTSVGTLIFDNLDNYINFSGVIFDIEIEGSSSNDYDRIIVQGDATLTGATLNPIFTYAPLPGDMFSIITANSFSGSFSSPTQGQMVTVGNTSFTASYTGSTGTAINFSASDFLFPVELTAFTARPAGKAVQLQWATATETNNDYFSVEHSTDGRNFREIGRVAGAGTSQAERRYAFTDYSPAAGLNYYRLRQNDFDGRYEYSNIRSVVFDKESPWTIRPTLAHESVTVEWVSAPGGDSIIEAFNLAGKKVYAHKSPAQEATLQIPVQDWLPGLYWVLVRSNGEATARQFVKE